MLAISSAISVNFEATMRLESLTFLWTVSSPDAVSLKMSSNAVRLVLLDASSSCILALMLSSYDESSLLKAKYPFPVRR